MWKTNETLKWRAWEMWKTRAQKHGALSKLILNHVLQADSLNIKNAAFSTSMRTIAHAWWNVSASNSCYSHHWKFNSFSWEFGNVCAAVLGQAIFVWTFFVFEYFNSYYILQLKFLFAPQKFYRSSGSLSISISIFMCVSLTILIVYK